MLKHLCFSGYFCSLSCRNVITDIIPDVFFLPRIASQRCHYRLTSLVFVSAARHSFYGCLVVVFGSLQRKKQDAYRRYTIWGFSNGVFHPKHAISTPLHSMFFFLTYTMHLMHSHIFLAFLLPSFLPSHPPSYIIL